MKEVVTTHMEMGQSIINIDGYVHYHVEMNYGEDADGNRGEKRIFVDDVTNIQAYTEGLDIIVLTNEDKERASEKLAREFLEG